MKLSKDFIQQETNFSHIHYNSLKKRLSAYENDEKKEHRLARLECKTCFYLKGGLAGQAFTSYTCKNCEKQTQYPNTAVPKYCESCAKEHHCCVRCAATLN